MAENLEFSLQFQPQFSEPMAKYVSFDTYSGPNSMQDFITNPETAPLAYSGQLATCKDREGLVYILNEAKNEWLINSSYDYWSLVNGQTLTVKYGALYNWYAATDAKGISSGGGWVIPELADFNTLSTTLGGNFVSGDKLKEIGFVYWDSPNTGTNEVNFNLKGSGLRNGGSGIFNELKVATWLLGGADYSAMIANCNNSGVIIDIIDGFNFGYPIRLFRPATISEQAQADGTACANYVGNDGKIYRTVKIGTQVWLADNLCETLFVTGEAIPLVEGNASWSDMTDAAMCYYDNDINNAFTLTDDYIHINSKDKINLIGNGITITKEKIGDEVTINLTGNTSHVNLTNKNDELDFQHVTALEKASWDAPGFDYISLKTSGEFTLYQYLQGGYYVGLFNNMISEIPLVTTLEIEYGNFDYALSLLPKTLNSFSDWRLPVIDELMILVEAIAVNEGLEGYPYWSSDEDGNNAYTYTSGGSPVLTPKTSECVIMFVRLVDGYQLKNKDILEVISTGVTSIITEDQTLPGKLTLILDTEVKSADLHDKLHDITDNLSHSSTEIDQYKVLVPRVRNGTISDPDPNMFYSDGAEWKHIELTEYAQDLPVLIEAFPERYHAGQKTICRGHQYILNSDKTEWVKSDFQKITIGDYRESSESQSQVVSLDYAKSEAFYSAHGTCKVGNKFYIGERQSPTSICVFHDPKDLSNFTKITIPTSEWTIPGKFTTDSASPNWIESMCYDSVHHLIYATMYYWNNTASHPTFNYSAKIISINPDDISDYNIVYQNGMVDFGDSPTITTDGVHVYVGAYSYGHVYKFRISDWTIVQQITIPNMQGLHSSQIYTYSDRTELYMVGKSTVSPYTGGMLAKINCLNLTYTTLTLTGVIRPTDDFELIYKDNDGSTLYITGEADLILCVVDTKTMTFVNYPSVNGYFVKRSRNYIYNGGPTQNIARHEIANPNNVVLQTTGSEVPNELFVDDDGELFYTCWRRTFGGDWNGDRSLVHFKFYENTGGFVVKNNENILFKGEDGVSIDYLTAKTVTIKGSNAAKLQKFTAVSAQTTYTVTSFVLNSECLVFVDNSLQDVTVSGQNIILGFSPSGGEIIKVLNVTT